MEISQIIRGDKIELRPQQDKIVQFINQKQLLARRNRLQYERGW